ALLVHKGGKAHVARGEGGLSLLPGALRLGETSRELLGLGQALELALGPAAGRVGRAGEKEEGDEQHHHHRGPPGDAHHHPLARIEPEVPGLEVAPEDAQALSHDPDPALATAPPQSTWTSSWKTIRDDSRDRSTFPSFTSRKQR